MKQNIEWLSEEEGRIVFFWKGATFLTARVFVTGEEEAEFNLQDIVFLEKTANIDKIEENVILKMTKCIKECFRLLWENGFPEAVLVEEQGTRLAEILNSTEVVERAYSEYILKCHFEAKKTTDCGFRLIKGEEDDDGILYENEEKTFSCKILPQTAERPEEKSFYLHAVQVDKNYRNKGIATACLTALFRQYADGAPLVVYLQVGSYNKPAMHLYEKMGFEVFEEVRYYAARE